MSPQTNFEFKLIGRPSSHHNKKKEKKGNKKKKKLVQKFRKKSIFMKFFVMLEIPIKN
jgi:hypothetical protein